MNFPKSIAFLSILLSLLFLTACKKKELSTPAPVAPVVPKTKTYRLSEIVYPTFRQRAKAEYDSSNHLIALEYYDFDGTKGFTEFFDYDPAGRCTDEYSVDHYGSKTIQFRYEYNDIGKISVRHRSNSSALTGVEVERDEYSYYPDSSLKGIRIFLNLAEADDDLPPNSELKFNSYLVFKEGEKNIMSYKIQGLDGNFYTAMSYTYDDKVNCEKFLPGFEEAIPTKYNNNNYLTFARENNSSTPKRQFEYNSDGYPVRLIKAYRDMPDTTLFRYILK